METIVGIDLGTTNSEIAILKDGIPFVIPVENDPVMPSCVALDTTGKLLVGKRAKNQMVLNPESTIRSIKRKMGQSVKVNLGEKSFSPEEISSLILRELKTAAEQYLDIAISKAVITVPAYFDDNQRRATKDAGQLAGLEVVRIINEPTAAALAYESSHERDQRVLVYDLGGGTFDVSVVVIENGVVEVKASHGDTQLGGDDFDNLLINHIADKFLAEKHIDLRLNLRTRNRLWNAVEQAKRTLSDEPYAYIREEYVHENLHCEMEISRADYEELIMPLVNKTIECISKALRDASMLPSAIDRVILVGGSSRTPLVHRLIKEMIGKDPEYAVNPELIVAMGAAIQGGTIAGVKAQSVLVDITAHTFGTSAVQNQAEYLISPEFVYVPIIKRNTPLPAQKSEVFSTMIDNQEQVEVKIYEGEDLDPDKNLLIGKFMVQGLGKFEGGNPIVLTLNLDLDGILKVTATEKNTHLSKSVRIDTRSSSRQFDLQSALKNVSGILSEGEDFGEFDDIDNTEEQSDKQDLIRAKELRKRAEILLDKLDSTDTEEVQALISQTSQAILNRDVVKLKELTDSLEDMLFYLED